MNTFLSTADMKAALSAGEIDAFICSSNRGVEDCRIISQLEETNSFVLARKDDRSLLDPLDAALRRIHQNTPLFFSRLEEKYRISENGCYPALTREEADYISQHPNVTVLVGPQDLSPQTGEFSGSVGQVLAMVTEKTGLTFTPVTAATTSAIFNKLTAGEADMLFAFDSSYEWAQIHNARITEPYASFNCILVKGSDVVTPKTVAVVSGTYIAWYAASHFDYDLCYFDTNQACLDAVKRGQVDAVICNATLGNYYATFPQYARLVFTTMFDFSTAYSIAVSNQADLLLLNILDKAMASLPTAAMSACFEAQIGSRGRALTDVFYENPEAVFIAVSLIVLAVTALVCSLFYVRTIKRKNAQLTRANSAKTDFLSRVSHEMRTPMNGILGLTALMRDKTDLADIRADIDQLSISALYLLNLINDTLDMSRIESGKLHLNIRPMDSEKVLTNVVTTAHQLADQKQIVLSVELPPIPCGQFVVVMADASRLEQVLINLIANAVKYTPAGEQAAALPIAVLSGKRVLLCEDHPLNARIAQKLLEKQGMVVTWAEDGQKGLDAFVEAAPGTFDLIIMDMRMPVMDGLCATRAIRALDRADAATIPIIAMTSNAV